MALDRPFINTMAPVLLDRAEVKAYADRVDAGIEALWRAMQKHRVDYEGKVFSTSKEVDASLPKLPGAFVFAYRDFVASWKDFYEPLGSFNPVGPTVWSAWDAIEGYESQLKAYREKYISYGGKMEAPAPVNPSDVVKEHPGDNWNALGNAFGNLTTIVVAGAVIAGIVVLAPYLPSPKKTPAQPQPSPETKEKKNVPV